MIFHISQTVLGLLSLQQEQPREPSHNRRLCGFVVAAVRNRWRGQACGKLVGKKGARRPVSRVLSTPVESGDGTAIPLGRASRRASRGQPGRQGRTAPASTGCGNDVPQPAPPAAPIRPCSRWGLPCRPRCRGRGALLPHPFTLARRQMGPGGLLSVALSLGSPPPAVNRHRGSCGARTFLQPRRGAGTSGRPAAWRGGAMRRRRPLRQCSPVRPHHAARPPPRGGRLCPRR
jgi:hypothetical protein